MGMASADVPLARQSSGNVSPVPSRPPPGRLYEMRGIGLTSMFEVRMPEPGWYLGSSHHSYLGQAAPYCLCPVCHMLGSSSLEDCSHWLWVIVGKSDQR